MRVNFNDFAFSRLFGAFYKAKQVDEAMENIQNEYMNLEKQLETAKSELRSAQTELRLSRDELKLAQDAAKTQEQEKDALLQQLSISESRKSETEDKIRAAQVALKKERAKSAQLTAELSRYKAGGELDAIQLENDEMSTMIGTQLEEMERLRDEIAQHKTQRADAEERNHRMEAQLADIEKELAVYMNGENSDVIELVRKQAQQIIDDAVKQSENILDDAYNIRNNALDVVKKAYLGALNVRASFAANFSLWNKGMDEYISSLKNVEKTTKGLPQGMQSNEEKSETQIETQSQIIVAEEKIQPRKENRTAITRQDLTELKKKKLEDLRKIDLLLEKRGR